MQYIFGVDPSRKGHHELCIISGDTREKIWNGKVEGNQGLLGRINTLIAHLKTHHNNPEIIVGIEYQDNLLRQASQVLDVPIISVNPAKVAYHNRSNDLTGNKTDSIDAFGICDYLATRLPSLTRYRPPSILEDQARRISKQLSFLRQEKTLTWQRFWDIADEAEPELKGLLAERAQSQWFLIMMRDLFSKDKFHNTGKKSFIAFCQKRRAKTANEEKFFERVLCILKKVHKQTFASSILPLHANMLLSLMKEEQAWLCRAAEAQQQWKPGIILGTIPCLTPKTAVRLLAYLGEDWSRITPQQASAYAGQAPVTHKSGTPSKEKLKKMNPRQRMRYQGTKHHRLACNKDLKTTMTLFAFSTLQCHDWANEAYQRFRDRGQSHWEALRNLGIKWMKIIFALVRNQEPYNAYYHEQNIRRRQDPLMAH